MGNGATLRRQCSRPSSTLQKWVSLFTCLISPLSQPERFDRDFSFVVLGFGDGYCAGPQTRSWFEWCQNECFRFAGWQIAGGDFRSQDDSCPPPLSDPLALIAPPSHVLRFILQQNAGYCGDIGRVPLTDAFCPAHPLLRKGRSPALNGQALLVLEEFL